MLASVAVMVAAAGMAEFSFLGQGQFSSRPIATLPAYPPAMVDDVHRPGFNGRLWVTRPVIGGMQGPYAQAWGSPGPEAYGAYPNYEQTVYVRVGHTVIGINAWERIDKVGLAHLEKARQFWLRENNYTGGVRTFVNDTVLWPAAAPSEQGTPQASASETRTVRPRATIRVPADTPRTRHRIRVRNDSPGAALVAVPGNGPLRISWPLDAPADAVARTAARDGAGAPVRALAVRAE